MFVVRAQKEEHPWLRFDPMSREKTSPSYLKYLNFALAYNEHERPTLSVNVYAV